MKLLMIMDAIHTIHPEKDTSLALLLAADRRDIECYYTTTLFFMHEKVIAPTSRVHVRDVASDFYTLEKTSEIDIATFDIILMRKDPPVTLSYLYLTQLLDYAVARGVRVVNAPQGLRDANEKIAATWFPNCMVPSLVTNNYECVSQFFDMHHDIVCKPLDAMGGQGVYRAQSRAALEKILSYYRGEFFMAQRYIPEVVLGDKRVFIVHGECVPVGLLRVPASGVLTANLATGGVGVVSALTEREQWICSQLKSTLLAKGLLFVGIDIIGGYLTEINVTSPTCAREIARDAGIDCCDLFFDAFVGRSSLR